MKNVIRSPWFLVGVGLLVVAALAGVIYGVVSHTEPGLMQVTPGFRAEDAPIGVCPGAYVPDETNSRQTYLATETAVRRINERLGFAALRIASSGDVSPPCMITVTVGVPAERTTGAVVDPGGAAMFSAGSRTCDVTTTNTGTDELLGLDLQHELGHCLGLEHDCWAGSIMCGGTCCTLAPTPVGSYPPRIDDSDRDLLRNLLGPR